MENLKNKLTVKQLNSSIKPTVKQLNSLEDYNNAIKKLPIEINENWYGAVASHIKRFGYNKVYQWAEFASDKRTPERYFMSILRRQAEQRNA